VGFVSTGDMFFKRDYRRDVSLRGLDHQMDMAFVDMYG
jgi:hypothetical protein